ncbi:hypothetical protein [Marivita hallyeonensis]|uniref:Uncharacterized protein n=1 Tax=Marivita hallyeonensis TaxID=996342 RepID=A0A1M5N3U2_9RHOB|nr:hypothetical protein [Marivita hallyeonensis]SHG84228.1 hypothetical protein SAMN05443551_0760 [Marivita hallyeonensis]
MMWNRGHDIFKKACASSLQRIFATRIAISLRGIFVLVYSVLALLLPSSASAWTYLGTVGGEIAFPTDVYVDWDTYNALDGDVFAVDTLSVYPHTIAGIDFFDDESGQVYDLRYPHRSYLTEALFDCEESTVTLMRTVYYSGSRPSPSGEVFNMIEDNVAFLPVGLLQLGETTVLDLVCAAIKENEGQPSLMVSVNLISSRR